MGCNCGKTGRTHSTRTYPYTKQGRSAQAERDAKTAKESTTTTTTTTTDKVPSKDGGTAQEFALVSPTGGTRTFGSRLEADAARVRAGYRGTVRRV